MARSAGYSGTPLSKKLGIIDDGNVIALGAPPAILDLLEPLPEGVRLRTTLRSRTRADVIVAFVTERSALDDLVTRAGPVVFPAGGLWICWPKRTSGVTTDITEDVLRDVILPTGLVDNKVCAIDATWSALRFVWRKELRV